MKSILYIIKVVLGLSMTVQGVDYSTFTSCSSLPKVKFQPQAMIPLSPFTVFASLNSSYKCSQNVLSNPSATSQANSYSVVNIQTNPTAFIATNMVLSSDSLSATITYCNNGLTQTVNMLESNLTNGNSYNCIYSCSPTDTAKINAFLCDGRTSDDRTAINSIVTGLQNLFASSVTSAPTSGCSAGQYCPLF